MEDSKVVEVGCVFQTNTYAQLNDSLNFKDHPQLHHITSTFFVSIYCKLD